MQRTDAVAAHREGHGPQCAHRRRLHNDAHDRKKHLARALDHIQHRPATLAQPEGLEIALEARRLDASLMATTLSYQLRLTNHGTTPLTALKLAEIIAEADLPPGVVNIITGAGATGAALVNHPGIDKVAFTGSTEVGKLIQRSLAGSGKKYTLELGGKAANIIFEDAAIDQAVEGIINGIFFNQGHVCCAGSRLFVQEGVAKEVLRKLKDRMATLLVGNPLDKNTDIGAINSKAQLSKIKSLVNAGMREGGDCWDA